MTDLPIIAAAARRLIDMGESGLLATLFGVQGSSYRLPGSMMLVTAAGNRIGGVSGGCLEDYIAREGGRLTHDGAAAMMHFDTSGDPANESSVPMPGCGGRLDVLVERLTAEHADWLEAAAAARETGLPSVIAHLLEESDAAGGRAVARVLLQQGKVLLDPSSVAADGEIMTRSLRVAATRAAFQGSVRVGGVSRRVLLQPIDPVLRLLVLGAGDDARAMVRQADLLGWEVTVCDRRARLATRDRFPTALNVIADDWERLLPALRVHPNTAAVLMTHSLHDDAIILAHLAPHALSYVGMLGPASRRESVLAAAADYAGQLIPRDFVDSLHGPAGLDLGLKSPEAIALSLAAEIVASLQGHDASPLSLKTTKMADDLVAVIETSR